MAVDAIGFESRNKIKKNWWGWNIMKWHQELYREEHYFKKSL